MGISLGVLYLYLLGLVTLPLFQPPQGKRPREKQGQKTGQDCRHYLLLSRLPLPPAGHTLQELRTNWGFPPWRGDLVRKAAGAAPLLVGLLLFSNVLGEAIAKETSYSCSRGLRDPGPHRAGGAGLLSYSLAPAHHPSPSHGRDPSDAPSCCPRWTEKAPDARVLSLDGGEAG